MTTKEAFIELFNSPKRTDKIKLNANTLRTIRKRIRDGKPLSINKMEDYLNQAGATKQPESWKFPK